MIAIANYTLKLEGKCVLGLEIHLWFHETLLFRSLFLNLRQSKNIQQAVVRVIFIVRSHFHRNEILHKVNSTDQKSYFISFSSFVLP